MNWHTAGWGAGFALLMVSPSARSAENDGAFRLSLQGVLFESRSLTLESGDANGGSVDVQDKTSGLLPSNLGLAMAYGLSESVALGANVMFGTSERTVGDDIESTKATSYQMVPFVEVGLSPGPVRPFLAGGVGLWGGSTEAAGEEVGSWSGYLFGGSFGLQLFAADGFSIDPGLSAYLLRGSYDLLGDKVDQTGTSVFLSVALTGWMGSSAPRTTEEASWKEKPEPASAQAPAPSPIPVREARGIMTASFPVGPSGMASLIAREEQRKERVLVQVRLATTKPQLDGCKELAFVMKQGEATASAMRYEANPTWEALRGVLSTEKLGEVAESEGELGLRTCGEYWELTEADRDKIYAFYLRTLGETATSSDLEGVRDRRGLLSAGVEIADKAKLILRGRPRTASGQVAVRLHFTTPTPQLASCRELTLRTGDESFTLTNVEYGETKRATFSIEALEGRLDASQLIAASEGDRLRVEACDEGWDVGIAQREAILRYGKAFQQRSPKSAEGNSPPE